MANESVLSWDSKPERAAWSAQLLASISASKATLDRGHPKGVALGYSALPSPLQTKWWAELLVEMARFESSWKPHEIYHEPPPLGVDSVGLLQLSYEDEPIYRLEKLDRAAKSLEDPLVNLRCAVAILAALVCKDGVVASSNGAKHKGGARYWSVLRTGHHIDEILSHANKAVGLG